MQEEKKCPHGGVEEVKNGKELLNTVFNDTLKNLMRKSECSFIGWQEKNGENHCLYSGTNEQFVDMLAHLIACKSRSSPFYWDSKKMLTKLNDKLNA